MPPEALIGQWALLLVAQVLVAALAAGLGPRLLLLVIYGALLFAGWLPREWLRRVLPRPRVPAD